MKINDLKKTYEVLQKKYKMPSFSDLNKYFEVDRVNKDTTMLLRDMRKVVMEKIIEYLRLVEMLINPTNAPPMFMQFVKRISSDERKTLENIYRSFIGLELHALELEIEHDEKRESAFLTSAWEIWGNLASDLYAVLDVMRKNFDYSPERKEKGYFG